MNLSIHVLFSCLLKKTIRCLTLIFPLIWISFSHSADPFDPDKTWFILGSTTGDTAVFNEQVLQGTNFPRPDGTATDINIVFLPDGFEDSPLAGLYQTFNFGGGRRDALRQLQQFKGALSVGVFLRDQRECGRNVPLRALAGDPAIAAEFGQAVLDTYISHLDEMIDFFAATGRDILLRIGNNFDDLTLCYTPDVYIAAFRAIKQRIDAKGATNIYTVWESTANPFLAPPIVTRERLEGFGENAIAFESSRSDHLDRWYPGDAFVDIIGFPYYHGEEYQQFAFPLLGCNGDRSESYTLELDFRQTQNRLLNFAKAHNKPAMITEAAPLGYNAADNTIKCQFLSGLGFAAINQLPGQPISSDEIWNLWYKGYFDFIRNNTDVIKAATYSYHSWATLPFESQNDGYLGDSHLHLNRDILTRFEGALREAHFKNNPLGELNVVPNFQTPDGRLEAERAQSPLLFAQGDFIATAQQVRVAIPGASNNSVYNVFNNGGELSFEHGVTAGNQITINFSSNRITLPNIPGRRFNFSVIVDGNVVDEVPFFNTFRERDNRFSEITLPANINDGSLIQLRLNDGGGIDFDFIRVENNNEITAQ